jgi:TusA-related sulfurtransferase
MKQVIDARGLACPQPVIVTRKALESSDSVITIVDNKTAVENIKRMANTLGCTASEEIKDDGIYMTIEHSKYMSEIAGKPQPCARNNQAAPASPVLVISQDAMGRGDDALGHLLIKSFFHTDRKSVV